MRSSGSIETGWSWPSTGSAWLLSPASALALSSLVGLVALLQPLALVGICAAALFGMMIAVNRTFFGVALHGGILALLAAGSLDVQRVGISIPALNSNAGLIFLVAILLVATLTAVQLARRTMPTGPMLFAWLVPLILVQIGGVMMASSLTAVRIPVQWFATFILFLVVGWLAAGYRVTPRTFPPLAAGVGALSALAGLYERLAPDRFFMLVAPLIETTAYGRWTSHAADQIHSVWEWPGYFAWFVALCLPFSVVAAFRQQGARRVAILATLPLMLAAIVYSGNRVTLVGVLLASLFAATVLRKLTGWVVVATALAVAATTVVAVLPEEALPSLVVRFRELLTRGSFESSASSRSELYAFSLGVWWSSPFLGIGLGAAGQVADQVASYLGAAHSFVLQVLVETGLVGAAAVGVAAAGMVLTYRRFAARVHGTPEYAYCVALGAASIIAVTVSLTDNIFSVPQHLAFFGLLQGLIAGGARPSSESDEREEEPCARP